MIGIAKRIGLAAALMVAAGLMASVRADELPGSPVIVAPQDPVWSPSYNDLGGTGLIQMPNGRMHEDGELAAGMSHVLPYYRYYFTMQVLPWLEGTFRYTQIQNRLYGPVSFSGDQQYKDRAVDLKLRLLREGENNPDVSVGLRDIGGTGLFSSEYVAASRRYYNFDFTLGMAWGNAGSRDNIPNPFGLISERFKTRPGSDGSTGQFQNGFFRGDAALFGGVEWQTPLEGVKLKLEYDGNSYQSEPRDNQFKVDSPFNVAVEYSPTPGVDLAAGAERGNQFMLRATLHANMNSLVGVPRQDPPPPVLPRPALGTEAVSPPQQTPPSAPLPQIVSDSAAMAEAGKRWGYVYLGMSEGEDELRLDIANKGPLGDTVPLAEFALDATRTAGSVKTVVTVVAQDDKGPVAQVVFIRDDLERSKALTNMAATLHEEGCCVWTALGEAGERGVEFLRHGGQETAPPEPQDVSGPDVSSDEADPPLPSDIQEKVARQVFADLNSQGMRGRSLLLTKRRATLHLENLKYFRPAVMVGRAAQIVANRVPASVEEIRLVLLERDLEISSFSLMRRDLERMRSSQGSRQEVYQHVTFGESEDVSAAAVENPEAYPRFQWSLSPQLRQHIGGPQNFYFYQIYASLSGRVQVSPGFSVGGGVGQDIYNNFDDLTLESDSKLPHVRSDIKDYMKGSSTWIDSLYANYQAKLAPGIYGRATAGVLELMYMGVSGELLYYPNGQSWAVGLDVNRVHQRDYNGTFGTLPYEVTTGNLTFYKHLPFWKLDASLSVGRYLAGDKGATVSLGRTFESGFAISVFATKTDVSAEQFGEGSFDKGFVVSIPMDLFTGSNSRTVGSFGFRPLTRDGGQKVGSPVSLYPAVDAGQAYRINDDWDYFGR